MKRTSNYNGGYLVALPKPAFGFNSYNIWRLDVEAGAKINGGEVGCDRRSSGGGKTNFEIGGSYWAAS